MNSIQRLLVNDGERRAWYLLNQVVHSEEIVLPKVCLADIFGRDKAGKTDKEHRFLLMSHFDFVVCDRRNLVPRLALEFDEPYHCDPKQKERDALKDRICQNHGLKLIRLKPSDFKSNFTLRMALERLFPGPYQRFNYDEEIKKFDLVIRKWNPSPNYVEDLTCFNDFRAILDDIASSCKQVAIGYWPGGWDSAYQLYYRTKSERLLIGGSSSSYLTEIAPTSVRVFNFQHRLDAQFIGIRFRALSSTGLYDDPTPWYREQYVIADENLYPHWIIDDTEVFYEGKWIKPLEEFKHMESVSRYTQPGALVLYSIGAVWQEIAASNTIIDIDRVLLDIAYKGEKSEHFGPILDYLNLPTD